MLLLLLYLLGIVRARSGLERRVAGHDVPAEHAVVRLLRLVLARRHDVVVARSGRLLQVLVEAADLGATGQGVGGRLLLAALNGLAEHAGQRVVVGRRRVVRAAVLVSRAEGVGGLLVEGDLHDLLVLGLVVARSGRVEVVLVGVARVERVGGRAVLALAGYARIRVVGRARAALVLELAALEAERVGGALVVHTARVVRVDANEARQAVRRTGRAVHGRDGPAWHCRNESHFAGRFFFFFFFFYFFFVFVKETNI